MSIVGRSFGPADEPTRMKKKDIQLKPIREQVMVITGASSGIGLVTAKRAAARGACVVLAARNEHDLGAAVDDIRTHGGRAIHIVADVSDPDHVQRIGDTAIREFGRIDTWVNNAAVSMYGRILELKLEDMRRQMDVNFWGQVYGSRAAVQHLAANGGALINVGSCLSDRSVPLQGIYCAAKHALKAFTDTLRMELEEQGVPVSVTLVKPSSIDTPFFEKARTLMGVEPRPVPPVYAPEIVADVILTCAEEPTREIGVGAAGVMLNAARLAPRTADRYMERTMFENQRTDQPANGRNDNLYEPLAHDGGERGRTWTGRTKGTSMYTAAALHPMGAMAATAALVGVAAIAGAELRRRLITQPRRLNAEAA